MNPFSRPSCKALVTVSFLALAPSLRAELIGYYDFNDPVTPLKDTSGKNRPLTVGPGTAPVWGATNGFGVTDGGNSGAYNFTAGVLNCPVPVGADAVPLLTWGAWVRTDSVAVSRRKIMGTDNGGQSASNIVTGNWDRTIGMDDRWRNPLTAAFLSGAAYYRYTSYAGNNSAPIIEQDEIEVNGNPITSPGLLQATPSSITNWAFIAAVYNQTDATVTMYLDQDASTTTEQLHRVYEIGRSYGASSAALTIGGIPSTPTSSGTNPNPLAGPAEVTASYWDGVIDNVFLFNEELSLDAIDALRKGRGATAPLPPTIASFTSSASGAVAPGTAVTLSWSTTNAPSLTITNGPTGITGPASSVVVNPQFNTTYTLNATGPGGTVTRTITVNVTLPVSAPVITEFMASNSRTLEDGDGNSSDWIELHNPNNFAISVIGYKLQDAIDTWTLPDLQIPANGYKVVFASNQLTNNYVDAGGNFHTNFSLPTTWDDEVLRLLAPNDTVLTTFSTLPAQRGDVSWGIYNGAPGYMTPATPGAPNSAPVTGFVADTKFDIPRGFYTAPVNVTITSVTPGASIVYTTNGTLPRPPVGATPAVGTVVAPAGPTSPPSAVINVATTTNLRAMAFKAGFGSTNVDTNSYLFLNNVILQTNTPPGGLYPTTWGRYATELGFSAGTAINADYALNQTIVGTTQASRDTMVTALRSLPSLVITGDPAHFFSAKGIYPNPFAEVDGTGPYRDDGDGQPFVGERPVSVEWIQPDGAIDRQFNCGIQLIGGWSRHFSATAKKSFRLVFKSKFGTGTLKLPWFGQQRDEFQEINLRAHFSDAWVDNAVPSSYLRDSFTRDTAIAMGAPASRGNHMHLYINGIYWGIYNPTERPDADFAAALNGGTPADYTACKHKGLRGPGQVTNDDFETIDGNAARYQAALTSAGQSQAVAANYAQLKTFVDMTSLADYCVVNMLLNNTDWPHKNWYAFGRTDGSDGGFKFVPWDNEYVMGTNTSNDRTGVSSSRTPGRFYSQARANLEFKILFGDRIYKHALNGGPLSPASLTSRWQGLVNLMDPAIIAEAARWGDNAGTRMGTRNFQRANWVSNVREVQNLLPTRWTTAIGHFRAAGLYPAATAEAPAFVAGRGSIPAPGQVYVRPGSLGTILYTIDGSDPRLVGGAVNPSAQTITVSAATLAAPVTVFDFECTGWKHFTSPTGLGNSDIAAGHPLFDSGNWKHTNFDDASWTGGATTQAMLGFGDVTGRTIRTTIPAGNVTSYYRKTFSLATPEAIAELQFSAYRDDGAIFYLNGVEIHRDSMPPTASNPNSIATPTTPATVDQIANEGTAINFTYRPQPGILRAGNNILAVELHQNAANSSDAGLDISLKTVSSTVFIPLAQSGTIKARFRNPAGSSAVTPATEWSALAEGTFSVGAEAASASNLIISKILYRPTTATPAEITAGFTGRSPFEYLELYNHGTAPLTLTGATVTGAIDYAFPTDTPIVVNTGERVILAATTAAFRLRYGNAPRIVGEYLTGRPDNDLDNDGGEIIILAPNGADILRFTYNATGDWPSTPDTQGKALVLVDPDNPPTAAQLSNGTHWRVSTEIGGQPGVDDRIMVNTWLSSLPNTNPLADPNYDEINQLLAFAIGAGTNNNARSFLPTLDIAPVLVAGVSEDYLVMNITLQNAAGGITTVVQSTDSLGAWVPTTMQHFETIDNGSGTLTRRYRSTVPYRSLTPSRQYYRLSVTINP